MQPHYGATASWIHRPNIEDCHLGMPPRLGNAFAKGKITLTLKGRAQLGNPDVGGIIFVTTLVSTLLTVSAQ